MKVPFIGGAYAGFSSNENAQTCVNLFVEVDQVGGKEILSLIGAPGLAAWYSNGGTNVQCRGLRVMGDYLYAVIANKLYEIDSSKNAAELGTLSSSSGYCFMEDNGDYLMIVDTADGKGWTYKKSTDTFAEVTDEDFPAASSLAYQDGYFIVTEADSDTWYISDLNDPTSWVATEYKSAERRPDDLVRQISDHGELFALGSSTVQAYYNSGDSDFPFDEITRAMAEVGCGAAASVCQFDNSIAWLTERGQIAKLNGYTPQVISTRQIEYQIAQYSDVSDAIAFSFVIEGHEFYQITFPTGDATWVYDASTGFWHERKSYKAGGGNGRHRAMCYAKFNGAHLIGDYYTGDILELDMDTYQDNGQAITRERTGMAIHSGLLGVEPHKSVFWHEFELEVEAGVGTGTSNPTISLDWSDDGGHTFVPGTALTQNLGTSGEYGARPRWRSLGASRSRIPRITTTAAVKITILSAHLTKLRIGAH